MINNIMSAGHTNKTKEGKKKFLHLTHHIHEGLFADSNMIGGFYNNHLCFNSLPDWTGEFGYLKTYLGRLNEFDIIYVCFAKPELDGFIIDEIRKEIPLGSKTLIIGSIDYAVEIWDQPFNVHQVRNQMEQCDIIFASEPSLGSVLKSMMNHKVIRIVPHATNVDYLKTLRKPWDKRQQNLVTLVHRYDNNWKACYQTLMRIIEQRHNGIEMPELEACILAGDENARIELLPFFGRVNFGTKYTEQMEYMSRQLICLDSYHRVHTYGRTVVDMAAIGVPLVGTKLQYLQNDIFPTLSTEPYDLYSQQNIIERLIRDKEFYRETIERGYANVDKYGYENTAKRFLKAVEDNLNNVQCDVESGLYLKRLE